MPLWMQFDRGTSISLNKPAKGTAGSALVLVRGQSSWPGPPPRIMAATTEQIINVPGSRTYYESRTSAEEQTCRCDVSGAVSVAEINLTAHKCMQRCHLQQAEIPWHNTVGAVAAV
jgi:hypothetical protein